MKSFFGAGINDYEGTGSDLQGCVNDTMDWHEKFKCDCSTVLLNEQATKAAMVQGIKDTLAVLGPGETALIQYSGHGSWVPDEDGDEPDGKDECLCCYDFRENVLIDDELRMLLADRHPKSRVFLVTDSCHSGSVFRLASFSSVDDRIARIKFLPPHHFVSENKIASANRIAARAPIAKSNNPLPGVIHFSGCRDFEYSYDASFPGKPNGAFTYFALQAFNEAAVTGAVTYKNWHAAIRKYLPSMEYPQVPVFNATKAAKNYIVSN